MPSLLNITYIGEPFAALDVRLREVVNELPELFDDDRRAIQNRAPSGHDQQRARTLVQLSTRRSAPPRSHLARAVGTGPVLIRVTAPAQVTDTMQSKIDTALEIFNSYRISDTR